ncbi:hypothetical protein OB13_08215, partial [Pontibacter sp. HJ8]
IDFFFEPGTEILVAKSGDEVAAILADLSPDKVKNIGQAAYRKVLDAHTYSHRAAQLEKLLYSKIRQQKKVLA